MSKLWLNHGWMVICIGALSLDPIFYFVLFAFEKHWIFAQKTERI